MSTFDAIILGGGIIGASLAEELARHGRRVALVERARIGAEASSAAAGVLSSQMDVPQPDTFFDLCQASRKMYPRWVEHIQRRSGLSVGYSADGVLYIAMTGRQEAIMDRRIRWQMRQGLKAKRLSARDVKRLYPVVDGRIKRGYFFPNEAQIDNALLMEALGIAVRKAGVQVFEGVSARRLRVEQGKVQGVETDQNTLRSPVVVNCLGSWSGFEPASTLRLPVQPIRGQIMVFDAPRGTLRFPVMAERAYAVQRQDGRVLVGSTLEAAGFQKALTAGGMHDILCGLKSVMSAVNSWTFAHAWAGLRPCTPDKLPILGPTPIEGFFVATAHYRHGILLAPITARILTDLILTGRTPFDLELFSPLRFK